MNFMKTIISANNQFKRITFAELEIGKYFVWAGHMEPTPFDAMKQWAIGYKSAKNKWVSFSEGDHLATKEANLQENGFVFELVLMSSEIHFMPVYVARNSSQ